MPRNSHLPKVFMAASPPPPFHGVASVVSSIFRSPLNQRYQFSYLDLRKKRGKRLDDRFDLVNLYYTIKQGINLTKAILVDRVDIVHFHFTESWGFRKNSVYLLLSKLLGRKAFVQIHGARFDTYYENSPVIERKFIQFVLRRADEIGVSSPYWKEFCGQIVSPTKIHVIPNAVNWEFVPYIMQDASGAGTDTAHVNVLFLGSLGHRKGTFDLLKAIPLIVEENPNVRFSLAGREERKGEGQKIRDICERDSLHPYITFVQPDQDELLKTYEDADIYTLPSYADAFPVAMLEAMAMGLPVVSTRVGGIPEIIEEGKGGFLIEPGDHEALAQAILRLAAAPELRLSMGLANRQKVREHYSPQIVTQQIGSVYESLLAR